MVLEFGKVCASLVMAHTLYWHLFEQDERRLALYDAVSPLTFHDLSTIVGQHVLLQFAKLTDRAQTSGHANLTTNYILETIPWPNDVREQLGEMNGRLMEFRAHIEEGRSKRIAHIDLRAQMEQLESLGGFPKGADSQFIRDLQDFVDIAYGHLTDGDHISLHVAMSDDVYLLVRALEKSALYDQCTTCDQTTRAIAILDYEDRNA